MQSHNRYRGIDSYALSCARFHAQRLSQRHPCFVPDDYEDIEQELILYFLTESPKYDPAKSPWKLHIFMIMQRYASDIAEAAERKKRGGLIRPSSFFQLMNSEHDGERDIYLIDTIRSDEGLWDDAFQSWNSHNIDIQSDIQKAIAGLPLRLQQLCFWLQYENPTDISRRTGIPRTTLNSLMSTLRKRLKEAGLENYFQISPSLSETPPK